MVKMKNSDEGYLYIANGEKYVEEAINSARSLRKTDKNASITLVTNKKIKTHIFDNIIVRPLKAEKWTEGLLYKVQHMYDSPYKKTFFIDSDTYFCENCRELFGLLDYFDICIAQAPNDTEKVRAGGRILDGLYPYNTGVVLFRKNRINSSFFKKWHERYSENFREYVLDQAPFMETFLAVKPSMYVLQSIYNARTPFCIGLMERPVKIIHGRHEDYEAVKNKLNRRIANRAWIPKMQKCIDNAPSEKLKNRVFRKIRTMIKRIEK